MSKTFNFDALRSAKVHTEPWRFAYHGDAAYDPDTLCRTHPGTGFEPYHQKAYIQANGDRVMKGWYNKEERRLLIEPGSREPHDPATLQQPWIDLCEDLLSDEYREALEEIAQFDMRSLALRVYYHRQGGDYGQYACQTHVDPEYERVTHVYFLDAPEGSGSYWMTPTGDRSERHLGVEILPEPNQNVIQVRSDNAWHGISGHNVPRQMLHIVWEGDH